MTRRLPFLAFALLLGATLNTTIAWACVLFAPTRADSTAAFSFCLGTGPTGVRVDHFDRALDDENCTFVCIYSRDIGIGITDTLFGGGTLKTRTAAERLVRAGWPFPALRSRGRAEIVTVPMSIDELVSYPSGWPSIQLAPPRLPLVPEPIGFAANTVLCALLVAALMAGANVASSRRRHRRGLCPHCAYTLSGLPPNAPCPECGHARP